MVQSHNMKVLFFYFCFIWHLTADCNKDKAPELWDKGNHGENGSKLINTYHMTDIDDVSQSVNIAEISLSNLL